MTWTTCHSWHSTQPSSLLLALVAAATVVASLQLVVVCIVVVVVVGFSLFFFLEFHFVDLNCKLLFFFFSFCSLHFKTEN